MQSIIPFNVSRNLRYHAASICEWSGTDVCTCSELSGTGGDVEVAFPFTTSGGKHQIKNNALVHGPRIEVGRILPGKGS
jgi:hypothetical protein